MTMVLEAPTKSPRSSTDRGYGRARLWVGISGVGTWVVLSVFLLATDFVSALEAQLGSFALLGSFVVAHALVQFPFDLFGGYLLPRKHGRTVDSWPTFLRGLLRGIAVHGTLLFGVACTLLFAGRSFGVPGVIGGGVLISIAFLALRGPLARLMAGLSREGRISADDAAWTVAMRSADEGFTGGVLGTFRPKRNWLPARWNSDLGVEGFTAMARRRELAVSSGAWQKGRWGALLFHTTGLSLGALLVGESALGTAAGIVQLSLSFTLWSFLGLLILPTLSRRAVYRLDARLIDHGEDPREWQRRIVALDGLSDGESHRPSFVETIFHPIPSVSRRGSDVASATTPGAWDIARTSLYLGNSALGLLGRSVHCNAGRPALWVFLPTD